MKPPSLGRLHKVDLREAWSSESSDFTPWLAQEENLKLLGEAVGIELELESQEKEVGLFRADILCKDTANDSWVLIENQLEKTDHSHLGQLLTYAAGLNAVTIVWIAEHFTEERLAHIHEHAEMVGLDEAIGQTLSHPALVIESLSDPSAALHYRYFLGTQVGDKWLCVVVKYSPLDAFVLTAYLTDKPKKGIQLWPKP